MDKEKEELKKELFKKILGEMIDTKYEKLSSKEIKEIAFGAISRFESFIN